MSSLVRYAARERGLVALATIDGEIFQEIFKMAPEIFSIGVVTNLMSMLKQS